LNLRFCLEPKYFYIIQNASFGARHHLRVIAVHNFGVKIDLRPQKETLATPKPLGTLFWNSTLNYRGLCRIGCS